MEQIRKAAKWKDTDAADRKTLHLAFLDTDYLGNPIGVHLVRLWISEDDKDTDYDVVLRRYKGYLYVERRDIMLEKTWVKVVLAFSELKRFLSTSKKEG